MSADVGTTAMEGNAQEECRRLLLFVPLSRLAVADDCPFLHESATNRCEAFASAFDILSRLKPLRFLESNGSRRHLLAERIGLT